MAAISLERTPFHYPLQTTVAPDRQTPPSYLWRDLCFNNHPNQGLFWEAVLALGRGSEEKAKTIAGAILSQTSMDCDINWKTPFPENVEDLFDRIFINMVADDPQTLSSLGLLESVGLKEHNRHLNQLSIFDSHESVELKKELLQELNGVNPHSLTTDQELSVRFFKWLLELQVAKEPFLFHTYQVTHILGTLQHLVILFTSSHRIEDLEDVENYLIRLQKISQQLHECHELMAHQCKLGIVPPSFSLEKIVAQIEQFMTIDPTHNLFIRHLEDKLKEIRCERANVFIQKGAAILAEKVYPAYEQLAEYCRSLIRDYSHESGVHALPDGESYYSYMLKLHTTTDLNADEIHEIGLREVESIQNEMVKLFQEIGLTTTGKEISELFNQLNQDKTQFYSDSEDGQKQCLDDFYAINERARTELSPLFDLKPSFPVSIQPVPAHEAKGAPSAYYLVPSLDGKRPGVFYANLENLSETPKYSMETLTVHEAEPGHHFQFAIQNDLALPLARKIRVITAFCEGWALYTEKLADENGFFSSPQSRLGYLRDQLLRAARLVVDTGIHHKKWSKQMALDYLEKTTGYEKHKILSEVERYFVWPGQACSYKIGQIKILELRQKAQEMLHDRFDIREFHNRILKLGAVPLAILDEEIDAYIEEEKNRSTRY